MEAVTVRPMRAEEARDVRKMGRRAFAGLESLWVSKPGQALVAVREDKIVGAVLYKLMNAGGKKIAYVDYAFVDPDYHNQGIGGSLYRAATEFLWALSPDALTAIVKDDNVGSWCLFLKNGFSRVSLPQLAGQFGFWGAILRDALLLWRRDGILRRASWAGVPIGKDGRRAADARLCAGKRAFVPDCAAWQHGLCGHAFCGLSAHAVRLGGGRFRGVAVFRAGLAVPL